MERDQIYAAATDERHQIADLVAGLDDTQLTTPSLCPGWDVKTVAAHVVSTVIDGTVAFLTMALRHGSTHRGINALALRRARQPASQIVGDLRQCADTRVSPPGAGPLDPLADVMVHGGDIRLPLGLPFRPDVERAALALDFLTGPWRFAFVPRSLTEGLRLQATDVDRTWGDGDEVVGPVAAIMMTACGRTACVDTLDGPGLLKLQSRLAARH